MKSTAHLFLADIDNFDPQGVGRQRRLCPLCGEGKPKDGAHRSVTLGDKGLWHCHRCKAGGQLREFWTDKPPMTKRERAATQMQQVFAPSTLSLRSPLDPAKERTWRKQLEAMQPMPSTRGESYLNARGIYCEIAHKAGVRYLESWFGRSAIVFPSRDLAGRLVGAQGRYVDGRDDPKTRTAGRDGVFATDNVWNSCATVLTSTRTVVLTEAPLDALSLAMCGLPAVAVFGCNLPSWMHRGCAFQRVLIATDADEVGDKAAHEWITYLSSFGANCRRLRPEGAKDWNELLQRVGAQTMRELVNFQVEEF